MSNHAAITGWFVFLAPLIFHESAEVGNSQAWNQVYRTYNTDTDQCSNITDASSFEAREAANSNCVRAFEALDEVKENFCGKWRYAECRKLPEHDHLVCSCYFASRVLYGIKINGLSSFRDCAWNIFVKETRTKQAPAPSENFKRKHDEIYDEAKKKSHSRKAAKTSSQAGPSNVIVISSSDSSHSSSGNTYGEGTALDTLAYVADATGEAGPSRVQQISSSEEIHSGSPDMQSGISAWDTAPFVLDTSRVKAGPAPAVEPVAVPPQPPQSSKKSHKKDIRCPICGTPFSKTGNFDRHMSKFHKNPSEAGTGSAVNPFTNKVVKCHTCKYCKREYLRESDLLGHIKRAHKDELKCKICNLQSTNRTQQKTHMETQHPEIRAPDAAGLNYRAMFERYGKCLTCGACCRTPEKMREHMLQSHQGDTYCHLCDQTFPGKSSLNEHNEKEHS